MTDASDTTQVTIGELGDDDVPELYRSGRAKAVTARNKRWVAYLVGIAAVAGFVLFADWDAIRTSYFNSTIAREQFPDIILVAAKNTIIYTVFSVIGGVILGLTISMMRMSSIRPYRWFGTFYVEVFRGLPALLTIILVGFLTPIALGVQFPEVLGLDTGGIVALSLVAGAYLAETFRAGIEAVPRGQIEAARSLGMSQGQTLRIIVIPQAFRIVIPPLTNEMVLLLKDTALLAVLGTTLDSRELTKFARDASGTSFNGTPLVVAGAIYLIITIPLTRLVAQLEKKNKAIR